MKTLMKKLLVLVCLFNVFAGIVYADESDTTAPVVNSTDSLESDDVSGETVDTTPAPTTTDEELEEDIEL